MPNFVQKATASIKGSLSGHKELNQYISAHKDIKTALKAWSSAQLSASKYLDKWGVKEGGDLGDVIAKVHELEIKWCEQQTAMLGDVKASKKAFVSILKQEQAADYAERSSQQAMKQVSKAEKMLASLKKKGANTATAETKLRQAQSIYEMCDNEKSSMSTRTNRVKARQLKRAMVAKAEAHLELFRQGIILFEAQKIMAESLSLDDDNEEEAQAALAEGLGGNYRPRSASVPRSQSDQLPDRPFTFCGVGSAAIPSPGGGNRFASWSGGSSSHTSPNNRSHGNTSSSNTDKDTHAGTTANTTANTTTTTTTDTNTNTNTPSAANLTTPSSKGGKQHLDVLINDLSLSRQIQHSPGSIRSQRVQSRISAAAAAQDADCSGFSGTGRSSMFLPSAMTSSPISAGNALLNRTAELSIFSPARKAPSIPMGISPHGAEPLYADPDSARSTPDGTTDASGGGGGNTDALTDANTVANSHYSTNVAQVHHTSGFTPGHSRTGSNASSKSKGNGKGHSRSSSTGSAALLTEAHAAATSTTSATSTPTPSAVTAVQKLNAAHLTLANASFVSQDTAWAQSAWNDHGSDDIAGELAASAAAIAAEVAASTYNHPQDDVSIYPPHSVGADSGVGDGGGPASVNSETFEGMDYTNSASYQNVSDVNIDDDNVAAHYQNVANLSSMSNIGGIGGSGGGPVIDPYDSDPDSRRNSTSMGLNSANHSPDGYGFHNRSGAASAEAPSEDEGLMEEGVMLEGDVDVASAGARLGANEDGMVAQAYLQPITKHSAFNTSAFNTIPAPKINSALRAAGGVGGGSVGDSRGAGSATVAPGTDYI